MRRTLVVLLCALYAVNLSAQTRQDQARIDYESAKRLLASEDYAAALKKVESAIQVLGQKPELLTLAAECALKLDDRENASAYVKKAFAAADEKFRKTPAYERLVSIAADVESSNTAAQGAWKKPHQSLCSMEYFPLTPTYKRRYRTTNSGRSTWDYEQSVKNLTSSGAILEVRTWDTVKGDVRSFRVECDTRGLLKNDSSGKPGAGVYDVLASMRPGVSWTSSLDDVTRSGKPVIGEETCKVEALEEVTVPAGTFKALRVSCESKGAIDEDHFESSRTTWYVSGIGEVKAHGRSLVVVGSDSDSSWDEEVLLTYVP